eukprot:TRINITY_DN5834_c0_g1_i2.p1 TRINITY_DN5834_c0_g1~~TRINITY_DN5834_c0_g1_i2.p1  ORF type:complete len:241 (-),score=18.74 TRINITY_DN5834_c0_g1_i2:123-845(-)
MHWVSNGLIECDIDPQSILHVSAEDRPGLLESSISEHQIPHWVTIQSSGQSIELQLCSSEGESCRISCLSIIGQSKTCEIYAKSGNDFEYVGTFQGQILPLEEESRNSLTQKFTRISQIFADLSSVTTEVLKVKFFSMVDKKRLVLFRIDVNATEAPARSEPPKKAESSMDMSALLGLLPALGGLSGVSLASLSMLQMPASIPNLNQQSAPLVETPQDDNAKLTKDGKQEGRFNCIFILN